MQKMQQNSQGYLLILVMIIMFAMSSIGLGIMTVVAAKYQHSSTTVTVQNAVYAAEAGITDTIQQLITSSSFAGWTTPRTLYDTPSRGKATYTTTVTSNADGTKTILSTGTTYRPNDTVAYNTKRVQAIVKGVGSAYKLVSDIGGGYDMCATASGKAYCWGKNYGGDLGTGNTTATAHPIAVTATGVLNNQTILSVQNNSSGMDGYMFACALGQNSSQQGAVFCWGQNGIYGMLGNNSTAVSYTPVAVTLSGAVGNQSVTNLGVGKQSSCLVAGGKPYCWGDGSYAVMGNGTTSGANKTPVAVTTSGALAGKTTTMVAVNNTAYYVPQNDTTVDVSPPTACAVAYTTSANVDGQAYCWGDNTAYQSGTGTASTYNTTPVRATGALTTKNVTQVSPGYNFTCAVASGQAYCWGYGNIGTGSSTTKTPTLVSGGDMAGKTVTAISSGSTHVCAVASGQAYCWGSNIAGESGYPTSTNNVAAPNLVPGFSGKTVTNIWSAGTWYTTCATAYTSSPADTQMYCWGNAATNIFSPGNANFWPTPTLVDYSSSSGFYGSGGTATSYTILDYQQKYP